MAKQPQSKGGMSRIRFIMLDAEIPEGDLSQITLAIQNALKPAAVIQQRIPAQSRGPTLIGNDVGNSETLEEEAVDPEGPEVDEPAASQSVRTPRGARPRKPTTPNVVDADFDSEVSLSKFADSHPAKAEVDRNLVIAAWFKEHRSTPTVTADHIYTGYRKLGWSTGFSDFAWPLRANKKNRYMASPIRGEYAINHLGLDRVTKLGSGSE